MNPYITFKFKRDRYKGHGKMIVNQRKLLWLLITREKM